MKTYLIRNQFASSLVGLPGIYVTPYSSDYKHVDVFDVQNHPLGFRKGLIRGLPNSVNAGLVHDFLKQLQQGKVSPEGIASLKKYLQCAEKKDKNSEINADIKSGFKDVIFGLLLIMVSAGGFILTVMLTGLFPVYASWITLLLIPVVTVAVYGGINALVGLVKLGVGLISSFFRKNNVESLPLLEKQLKLDILQSELPSYDDTQKNYYQSISVAHESELAPPTYQQATSPVYVPAWVTVPGATANFFQAGQSPFNHREVNDNPLPRCQNF